MRFALIRFLLAPVFSVGLVISASVFAQEGATPDRVAIRAMISGQIDAFRRDDALAAYSFAAPGIRGMFPSVGQFMAMVRNNYRPVYRPRAVTFGELFSSPDGVVQKVYVTGPEGKNWLALYSLEQQPDGDWKISGCVLAKDDSPNI